MLAKLQLFDRVVTLVPRSGVQFVDFGLDLGRYSKLSRAFWEEKLPDAEATGAPRFRLRFLEADEDTGELFDTETGRPLPPSSDPELDSLDYTITARRCFDPFLGRWIPLPFFRITESRNQRPFRFAPGPTNWARLRVVELPHPDEEGNTHRLTVAFDTDLLSERSGEPYLAPTPRDIQAEAEFAMAASEEHNSWFLHEGWVDGWLERGLKEWKLSRTPRRRVARAGQETEEAKYPFCQHWAYFLTCLRVLDEAEVFPRIRFVDPTDKAPIGVDLVLDVGNARTCGILVEARPDGPIQLTDSYVLELRDLSKPEQTYAEPFETRIEFAIATFGDEDLSRRSGRARAFEWPHVVRVGPEATRLSFGSRGTNGSTGMSSPKRYLWDDRPRAHDWRFNSSASNDPDATEPPAIDGAYVQLVKDNGDPAGPDDPPALRAYYSRSSLMMFALSEIFLQALVLINSVARRYSAQHPGVPRRLQRLIMTMPTGMPLEERRIYKRRADAAVRLLWQALEWDRPDTGAPLPPTVELNWDEATCTQLVYLYTEITQKYQGDTRPMMTALGKERESYGQGPCLRVASIDVGGGTTDLIITTYVNEAADVSAAVSLRPTQNFREGFLVAGDDILLRIVERHVLPVIMTGLKNAGVKEAKGALVDLFGGDRANLTERERVRRKQFAEQVAAPIALAMLQAYEGADLHEEAAPIRRRFDEFFPIGSRPALEVREFLEAAAGSPGRFRLSDLEFEIDMEAIDRTVREVMERVLTSLCEVIRAYDCDVLLLSGRPSRLAGVRSCVYAKTPVPPSRIVAMQQYKAGAWYPFRDAAGRIDDPKTTAVVGAMLCSLAEGRLSGFHMSSRYLKLKSTARFIGEMDEVGKIRKDKVFFTNLQAEDEPEDAEYTHSMFAPVSIGFRQLDLERWPTTPLYRLEYREPQKLARYVTPLKVRIARREVQREGDEELVKEQLRIAEDPTDSAGAIVPRSLLVLRLQTLRQEIGYWLDTGILHVL